MDSITFNGIKYPIQFVHLEGFGVRIIGVESLEDELMEYGEFVSEEAMAVDSQIFFYVPDEIIEDGEKVMSYLNRHIIGVRRK